MPRASLCPLSVTDAVRAWAASLGCSSVANASACARTEMARRLQTILSSHGLRSVFWEEALHYGVAPPAIVAPWFTGASQHLRVLPCAVAASFFSVLQAMPLQRLRRLATR